MKLLIGGELVEGDGAALDVEEPARGEIFATVALPSDKQVDAAIGAARDAARGWAAMPSGDRAEMRHEAATRIRAKTDELAETMTREGAASRGSRTPTRSAGSPRRSTTPPSWAATSPAA